MKSKSSIDVPEGWLIDPNKKWLIHFENMILPKDQRDQEITVDMWGVKTDGTPAEFKSRRKVSFNEAKKIWVELVSSGWKKNLRKNFKAA